MLKYGKSNLCDESLKNLQEYIDLNMWQINAINEGIKQANEAKLLSTEEVLERLEKKRVQ